MKKSTPLWQKLSNYFPSILVGIFLLAIGLLLYSNLGRDGLFDWDEGIYAELGRQVLVTKNILITYWNGEPWLEKPPGIAWASAIGIAIAGPSAYGARLLMPLFAIYTLFIVYKIGHHLGGWRQGAMAMGILAGLNLFLGRTRAVNTDMALLASVTTTLLFLLENRPPLWIAFSIFGGVWFKGIAGLMGVIIAIPLLISRPLKYLLQLALYSTLLILPWHLYAYIIHKDQFLTPYLYEQVFRRATAQIEFHFENRWYYFNYLYENLGLGIILTSALGSMLSVGKSKTRFLVWWGIIPLLIFTVAKTRLFWYILPIYPAIALLISQAIISFESPKKTNPSIAILAIGILCQGLLLTSRSVELSKKSAPLPDRLVIAQALSTINAPFIHVLVPPSERLSEALLPDVAKLSSSFRYGGMPSFVYYSQKNVRFYYDVDEFKRDWASAKDSVALVSRDDLSLLGHNYQQVAATSTYLGITKE